MGDCQAVELGQCAHITLGIIAGAFSPEELLYIHGRCPRGAIAAGVVIDDVLIAEQVPSSPLQNFTEGERRLALLCEEYLQRGLVPHPRKTFKRELAAEVWGAAINGCSGVVRPSPKRVIPLMMLTSRLALLGYSTVALLQVISGSWISVLQTRRRMLCLLDHLYLAQQGLETLSQSEPHWMTNQGNAFRKFTLLVQHVMAFQPTLPGTQQAAPSASAKTMPVQLLHKLE